MCAAAAQPYLPYFTEAWLQYQTQPMYGTVSGRKQTDISFQFWATPLRSYLGLIATGPMKSCRTQPHLTLRGADPLALGDFTIELLVLTDDIMNAEFTAV